MPRELAMELLGGRASGFRSFFNGIKIAQMMELAPFAYMRHPLPPLFAPSDSSHSAFVAAGSLGIMAVLPLRSLAEILETIVSTISVFVIHEDGRPLAGDIKPRKPMSEVENIIDTNHAISVTPDTPSNLPGKRRIAALYPPSKNTGVLIITENFAQALKRDRGLIGHLLRSMRQVTREASALAGLASRLSTALAE